MTQCLFSLFCSFLSEEGRTIEKIKSYQGDFYIKRDVLIFSLAALHEFLNQASDEKIPYQEFQRQLYQSTLNQDLKAHGAQIVVHRSTDKVATNLYRLERVESADSNS